MFKGDHGLADAEDGITFDSMETSYRSAKAELTFNKYYHVFGYTRFESDNDDKSKSTADSGPGVWYDEDMNLPPVGQSVWTKNEDEAVKFLWE